MIFSRTLEPPIVFRRTLWLNNCLFSWYRSFDGSSPCTIDQDNQNFTRKLHQPGPGPGLAQGTRCHQQRSRTLGPSSPWQVVQGGDDGKLLGRWEKRLKPIASSIQVRWRDANSDPPSLSGKQSSLDLPVSSFPVLSMIHPSFNGN